MDITDRCNLSCPFCNRHDIPRGRGNDMDQEVLERIASEVFPHSQSVFLSCAAEPLVSPLFEKSLELTLKHNVPQTCFITNAALLDERRASLCLEYEVQRIGISIESVNPDLYARLRLGTQLERVRQNIDRLVQMKKARARKKPEIYYHVVLMRCNLEELTAVVDFARDHGADTILCQHMVIDNPAMVDECLYYHQDEANHALNRLREHVSDWPIPVIIPRNFRKPGSDCPPIKPERKKCSLPWSQLTLDIYGNVYPCFKLCTKPFGSLMKQSFEEIWQGAMLEQLRLEHTTGNLRHECSTCIQAYNCDYEWELSFVNPTKQNLIPLGTAPTVRTGIDSPDD